MNRELRPIVTGVAARGLAVNALAEAIEEHRLPRGHGEIRKRVFEPEPAEFPGSMRKDVDARAHRPDLGCRLVDTRGYTSLVQSQRQGQSADASAYDNRFHAECSGPRTRSVSLLRTIAWTRRFRTLSLRYSRAEGACLRP